MNHYGRVLKLRGGAETEYDQLHARVWPEVRDAIRRAGIRNYSIFRYQAWLFSYFELPDGITVEQVGRVFEASPECVRWERLMQTLQEPLPESGAGAWWAPMPEVFHFDGEPTNEEG